MKRPGLALAFVMILLSSGCDSAQPEPKAKPAPKSPGATAAQTATATPTPTTAPTAPTAPTLTRYSRAELIRRPCLALDSRDLQALGITGRGKQENDRKQGPSCTWKLNGQNVGLDLDVPQSRARTFTKNGRVSQVPVGQHLAVQSEFQRICFIFVALDDVDHLVGTTTIPEPGAPQDGTCAAGAAVAAAALTHLR